MACAQEVDICLLHQAEVKFISCIVHIATGNRVLIVTVHASQLHIFAVNLENFAHTLHTLNAEVVLNTSLSLQSFIPCGSTE